MVAEGTDMFAPWGLVGFINMQRYFHPLMIPDTPGDIAAREVRAAPHADQVGAFARAFHVLGLSLFGGREQFLRPIEQRLQCLCTVEQGLLLDAWRRVSADAGARFIRNFRRGRHDGHPFKMQEGSS